MPWNAKMKQLWTDIQVRRFRKAKQDESPLRMRARMKRRKVK